MMLYVLVALFGMLGAVCRYLISVLIPNHGFPVATLLINLVGCFLLAVIMKYLARLPKFSPMLITAMGTGFVGSFTTFSTFSVESIQMIEKQWYGFAALYIVISLIGGLLASRLGFYLSDRWMARKEAPHVH